MIIVWLAALGASIVVGLLVALAYVAAVAARGNRPDLATTGMWAWRLWLVNFALDLAILYFINPPLAGPYWGGQWLLWPLLFSGILALFGGSFRRMGVAVASFTRQINDGRVRFRMPRRGGETKVVDEKRRRGRAPRTSAPAGVLALALVVVVVVVVNGLIAVGTTWFDPNAKALAAIPHVTSEPASAQLPPTDVNHLVLVTHGNAAYLGQLALAASPQNLGSLYHTDLADYALQAVNGHLYWVAPLIYNNVWANLGQWESPGYVAVDAEDPNATPVLHTGYHLRYLPGALFNADLVRHVYLSGYTNGDLADATLEVDDNWQPYFTIALMQPERGFIGGVVKRVLLVDPQSGAIQNYAPGDVPMWVDRFIPSQTVADYLTWWGEYAHAPWLNPSGSGQQVPAVDSADKPQLIYESLDSPVWLVPMMSATGDDSAGTGVALYDTRDTAGRFYPLAGLGVTQDVTALFKSSPRNVGGYTPANVQLYSIYGEPTWVTSYVVPNDYGESFQAVGIVDARHRNGANVIVARTKAEALAEYRQWLADHNIQTGAAPTGKSVTVTGTVARVSTATQNGTTVYYLTLDGQTRIFEAGLALSPELPLVRPGDTVSVTFLDTGEDTVMLTAFDDLTPYPLP